MRSMSVFLTRNPPSDSLVGWTAPLLDGKMWMRVGSATINSGLLAASRWLLPTCLHADMKIRCGRSRPELVRSSSGCKMLERRLARRRPGHVLLKAELCLWFFNE